MTCNTPMTKYIKNFVTGHGITYERNKRNGPAFEKASELWKQTWFDLKDKICGESIVLVCGAKNNGKSSLMRYMINNYNRPPKSSKNSSQNSSFEDIDMIDHGVNIENRSLTSEDRYAYLIDFDPGQCELTTPGMISAHIIKASTQELQSPTYLNLGQHKSIVVSSVGGTNMSVNPRMFIENSRFVYNKVLEHKATQKIKRPIFINTMGHIRNVGLAMLMDLIKICKPTHLIVLNVETDPMRTIYADLNAQSIDNTRASFYYETNQQSQSKLSYQYIVLNLNFTFIDSTSVAKKNRMALQLAYMATIPEALYKPIIQLNAKWLSLRKVAVYCVSSYPLKEGIVLELLHHSWIHIVKIEKPSLHKHQDTSVTVIKPLVNQTSSETDQTDAICKIIDNVGENTLYGCGIVADIDLEKGLVSIITPVDQATLDCVDCIIKPLSIQVPREMIQDGF